MIIKEKIKLKPLVKTQTIAKNVITHIKSRWN